MTNFVPLRGSTTGRLAIYRFRSILSSVRQTPWRQLDQKAYGHGGLSHTNKVIVLVVVIASLVGIIGTEDTINDQWPELFDYSDIVFAWLFCLEYLVRLWVEGENPKFGGLLGRCRYALTPAAIIDLVAFLPALIMPRSNLFLLRTFRLLRILRLARLGRFSLAVDHLSYAIRERKRRTPPQLYVSYTNSCVPAAAMYLLEGESNPEGFGSIPRALWWSICTLTTVGYGDIYPHTALGKICSGHHRDFRHWPDRHAHRNSGCRFQQCLSEGTLSLRHNSAHCPISTRTWGI